MRNLKKILALVLALMMVLSMMVTASAASFTDSDTIEYAEAVEILAAVGALDGFKNEDGTKTFKPTEGLTRAQAAKIIAFIMVGDLEEVANLADSIDIPFTDVPSWAEPFVAYCYGEGILNGRTATTFDPSAQVTGFEFGKMLLLAGDYVREYENSDFVTTTYVVDGVEYTEYLLAVLAASNAGVAMETKTVAQKNWKVTVSAGLKTENVWNNEFALSKKLTREEACYLAFKAMSTTIESTFDITKVAAGSLSTDIQGRPETCKWVDADSNVLYVAYDMPLAIIDGTTYNPAVDTPSKYWDFTNTKYLYNGTYEHETWSSAADLAKRGMITELYGEYDKDTGIYTVEAAVSTEYYYATISNIAANKNISLTVYEAGYILGHEGAAKTLTVAYDATKTADEQSDNYKALCSYAKNTVLAVQVFAHDWTESSTLKILDVQVPTATKGVVTGAAIKTIEGTPAYSQSTVTFNGEKLYFSNEYARQAIDTGYTGTLYTLNGLVVGFVADVAPDAATDVIYVVDHFAVAVDAVDAVYDAYGKELKAYVPAKTLVYAQGVNLAGEVVTYLVGVEAAGVSTEDLDELTKYTDNEKAIKLVTAQSNGSWKVEAYAYATQINIAEDGISVDGTIGETAVKYYYDAAAYTTVVGNLSDIAVVAGENADIANAWVIFNRTTNTNKTVSQVFTWVESVGEPAPEHVFLNLGITTTPEKTILTDAEGKVVYVEGSTTIPVYVYTYTVFEAGELKTIKSYDAALGLSYFEYYVDEYGICVETDLDGAIALVTNVYGNYVSVVWGENEGESFENYDITGIKVVDLTEADVENEDAANGAIDLGETVVFYAVRNNVGGYDIDCIYIVAAASAES